MKRSKLGYQMKDADRKCYRVCDSTNMTWKRQNYWDSNRSVTVKDGGWEEGTDYKGYKEIWGWGDENILYIHCSGHYTTRYICQNSTNYILKAVNFTVHKLYLSHISKCLMVLQILYSCGYRNVCIYICPCVHMYPYIVIDIYVNKRTF